MAVHNPHINSAKCEGFQTPPPVRNGQHLQAPPPGICRTPYIIRISAKGDVFDDVLKNAKHRANDASNDVKRPPLSADPKCTRVQWTTFFAELDNFQFSLERGGHLKNSQNPDIAKRRGGV